MNQPSGTKTRRELTWQGVAVLAILILGAVGLAWACAWGIRG